MKGEVLTIYKFQAPRREVNYLISILDNKNAIDLEA